MLRALPLDKIEHIEALQCEICRSGRRALTLDFAKACMPILLRSKQLHVGLQDQRKKKKKKHTHTHTHAFGSHEAYPCGSNEASLRLFWSVKQAQPTACHYFEVFSLDGGPGLRLVGLRRLEDILNQGISYGQHARKLLPHLVGA